MQRVIDFIAGLRWRLILAVIAAAAALVVVWFAIVTPRLDLAASKADALRTELEATRAELKRNSELRQAEAAVAADYAKALEDASAVRTVRERRSVEIRDRIIERAAQDDGFVDPSMDAYLKDIAK